MPKIIGYHVSPGRLRIADLIFLEAARPGQLPPDEDAAVSAFLARRRAPCQPVAGTESTATIGIGAALLFALGGFLVYRAVTGAQISENPHASDWRVSDGDGELLFATLREVERYARRIGAQVDAMRPSLEHEGYWEGYRVYPSLRYARERGHRKIRVPLEV